MKKFLVLFPALAVALLLTACGKLPEPQTPQTPVSVEKALQEAIDADKETMTDEESMEADELADEDVTVELDEALDSLEADLDEALEDAAEATETAEETAEESTEESTEESAPAIEEPPAQIEETEEEEEIDEPIIIE